MERVKLASVPAGHHVIAPLDTSSRRARDLADEHQPRRGHRAGEHERSEHVLAPADDAARVARRGSRDNQFGVDPAGVNPSSGLDRAPAGGRTTCGAFHAGRRRPGE